MFDNKTNVHSLICWATTQGIAQPTKCKETLSKASLTLMDSDFLCKNGGTWEVWTRCVTPGGLHILNTSRTIFPIEVMFNMDWEGRVKGQAYNMIYKQEYSINERFGQQSANLFWNPRSLHTMMHVQGTRKRNHNSNVTLLSHHYLNNPHPKKMLILV